MDVSSELAKIGNDGDEEKFQNWAKALPWYKQFVQNYGEEPNLNAPEYDYRAAYKAGVVPQIYPADGLYHWDSKFKSANHPNRYVNGIDTESENGDIADISKFLEGLFQSDLTRKDNWGY